MAQQSINQKLPTKIYNLYHWLEKNAVDDRHIQPAKHIILALPEDYKTRQDVESAIKVIRVNFDRKIGSSPKGYWLMCTDDKINGQRYMTQQALSKMEVAVLSGVDPNIFYNKLNEIKNKCNKVADKQQRLTFGKYEKTEISRYSDDLKANDE